jgi:multiple sugar transport system ATP-binding protein
MVFQNYALYPHMNVFGNIAFGLQMRGVPKTEREAKVREAARILGIEEMLDRRPRHLSGGQRQRVAMGRAIVREPQAFLMDEPLSNLDAKLRVQMRAEIGRIQKRIDATTLYVTHDQTEAMTMGDRVAVMRHGVLQQFDAPQTLYDEPANLFVASFMGSPSMNLVEGELVRGVDGPTLVIGNERLLVPPQATEGRVIVGMRPEALRPATSNSSGNVLHGTVTLVEALGPEALVHAEIDAAAVTHEQVAEASVVEADDVELASALSSDRAMVVIRVEHGRPYEVGATVALTVDVSKLHYFDAANGDRIKPIQVASTPHLPQSR